ncbi:MAG TPA: branched-chain amino acid ABC transporter permease [Anaerolineae bacterium]|nr:branched-chain amino acid ABC transporter permease [Anaerolineae bacterium]
MKRGLAVLLIGLALAAVPLVASQYWTELLTQALILGAFSMGLDLLVGYTGMPSLGHAAFFGLSGYGTALAITRGGINPWLAAGIGILVSTAVAACFGPLAVRLRGLPFLTVTLAFGQLTWGLITRWGTFTGGENGVPGVTRPALSLGPFDLQEPAGYYWFTLVCLAILVFMIYRFARSSVGMSLLGVRDSDQRMVALGYNTHIRRSVAFIAAAVVAAVCGTLSVFFNRYIGPTSLDWRFSAQALLGVVIGGVGSLWGPLAAGSGLHVLKTYIVGKTELWAIFLGALYVLAVLVLPGGLASLPQRLRGRRQTAPWTETEDAFPR